MPKMKDPNRVRFTDYLGVTLMSLIDCLAAEMKAKLDAPKVER